MFESSVHRAVKHSGVCVSVRVCKCECGKKHAHCTKRLMPSEKLFTERLCANFYVGWSNHVRQYSAIVICIAACMAS